MGFVFCGRFCRDLAVVEDYVYSLRDLHGLVLNSGFVDGSYDSSVRLSCSVLVLTGCGVGVVDGRYSGVYGVVSDNPLIHVSAYPLIDDSPLLVMQALELMVAHEVLRSLDVDLMFMDGAYQISASYTFMSRHHRDVLFARDIERLVNEVWANGVNCEGVNKGFIAEVDRAVESLCSSVDVNGLSGEELYPIAYHVVWDRIRLNMLSSLLRLAEERGACVFWLAKEYQSSVLSRFIGSRWISDVALLTEGLSMCSAVYIPVHHVIGASGGMRLHEKPIELPDRFALWDLVYFKVHRYSPVLCLTYPSACRDHLECALGTLYTLSHGRGYPEPMIIVHSKSAVNRGFAKLIADKLYEVNGDVRLAKTARDAVGLG